MPTAPGSDRMAPEWSPQDTTTPSPLAPLSTEGNKSKRKSRPAPSHTTAVFSVIEDNLDDGDGDDDVYEPPPKKARVGRGKTRQPLADVSTNALASKTKDVKKKE